MTCIVGLAEDGKVYIGADSLGTDEDGRALIEVDKKVFHNGDFLIGRSGSIRMGQIIRYSFKPPAYNSNENDRKDAVFGYMATVFVQEMKATFDKLEHKEENKGALLVGFQGRLFRISADNLQVEEEVRGYNAMGIGADIAKGSLYTTDGMDISPKRRVEMALYASEKHNACVRHPFYIESI